MKREHIIIVIIFIMLSSCDFFKKEEGEAPIARVNKAFLYKSDIRNLVGENTTKEDSILLVNNYINQWARLHLLINGAEINLSQEKQNNFKALIEQYKNDLYIKAYLEALVQRSIDTIVSIDEALEVYNNNIEAFKLNEELIKFRYINISEKTINLKEIEQRFTRFDSVDKVILNSKALQFKSYSLNDSIWIRLNQAIEKIPVINDQNKNELLKKSNFIQLKDSLGLYLMRINDVLLRNDAAPLEYVMPTIKQIVINKRKLELVKQIEKDITKDAIKNKQFEIFN